MNPTLDELVAEIAFLKDRVQVLEESAFSAESAYIEGWEAAGAFLGVSSRTCRRRHEEGQFPAPCGFVPLVRQQGPDHERPRWRRADLVRYAETGQNGRRAAA